MFSYLPTWVFSRIPPVFFEGYVLVSSLLPLFSHVPNHWCMVLCSPTCLPVFFANTPRFFRWVRAGTSLATSLPLFSHVPNNWCMVPCSPTCLPGFFREYPPFFFEGYVLERSLLPRYLYFHMFQIIGVWSHVLLPAYLGFFTDNSHLFWRVHSCYCKIPTLPPKPLDSSAPELFSSHGFSQLIDIPTRVTENSVSFLNFSPVMAFYNW